MMMSAVPFAVASISAGLVSFLSPCVLPLVPGYLSLISGAGVHELQNQNSRLTRVVMLNATMFVTGLGIVFVAFGAAASAIGQFAAAHTVILNRLAGAIIVIFGLHITGLLPIKALYAERRFHSLAQTGRPLRAALIGAAFAFGWAPCVGPILAGILALATAEATVSRGVLLLGVYSLGLAVPFLLAAFGVNQFLKLYGRFRSHLRNVEIAGGALMVAIGVLVFTRHLTLVNSWLNDIPFFRSIAERFL
jgi:cytochrome c-type biogenesis protein